MARISQGAGETNHRATTLGVIFTFSALILVSYFISNINAPKPESTVNSVAEFFAEFPMHFQGNNGSFAHDVKFYSKGYQYDLLFLNNEVLLNLYSNEKAGQHSNPQKYSTKLSQISLEFLGSNNLPGIKGLAPVSVTPVSRSIQSSKPIKNYTEVKYANVYPGIDVYFRGKQKQLFYEFILSDKADMNDVKLKLSGMEGAGDIKIDIHGNITVSCYGKKMIINKPQVYRLSKQQKQRVEGYFYVTRNNEIRFKAVEQRELI